MSIQTTAVRLLGGAAALALLLSCASGETARRATHTWTVMHDGPRDHATIGEAVAAAGPGDTVRIGPGVWEERLVIDKPLTLVGAGALQTLIVAADPATLLTDADQVRIQQELAAADSDEARASILNRVLASRVAVNVTADDVHIEALGIRLDGRGDAGSVQSGSAIMLQGNGGRLRDCAIVGSPSSGITVQGDDVVIRDCLVAAVEATGIAVARGHGRVEIRNCDVRDAIHRGITIARDDTLVVGCRISGSSWHGIRYDGVDPTIRNNVIFANKRSGIYASGRTSAQVTGNLLLENGFNGLSAWFDNSDTLERNTFAYNGRAALEVLGASQPVLTGNIFAWSPTGVLLGDIGGKAEDARPDTHNDGQLEDSRNKAPRVPDRPRPRRPAGGRLTLATP